MVRLAYDGQNFCSKTKDCPDYARASSEWIVMFEKQAKARAAKGDAEAMYVLYLGISDFEWLEKSAEAGYPQAQYLLAVRYKEGEGPLQWPWVKAQRIEELIKQSAEGGHPKGMNHYAQILIDKGDYPGARAWVIKMAETGSESGVGWYGSELADEPGELGFPINLVKGYGLMSLLLELDGGGDAKSYADSVMPRIASKMTSEQIEQAKAFAKEWTSTHPPLSYFPPKLGF